MAGNLIQAITWAVNIANDPSHGYDQASRLGPDYDCSSLVAAALRAGGFTTISPSMYTGNEYSNLTGAGFVPVTPIGADIRAGDVFFYHHSGNEGHTCMAINSAYIVEASGNEFGGAVGGQTGDQTGQEIRITQYSNNGWDYQMRYVEQASWISGPGVMTQAMMENNATIISNFLLQAGWSINAISAFIGNAQKDSDLNPAHWENYDSSDPNNAFGLLQWKPSTVYTSWALSHGYAPEDGWGQLMWVITDGVNSWQATNEYPVSMASWIISSGSPIDLSNIWAYNFEGDPLGAGGRAGDTGSWYSWFGGNPYFSDVPAWLLFKFVQRRRRNGSAI